MLTNNVKILSASWGDEDKSYIQLHVDEFGFEFQYAVFEDDPYPPHRQAFADALRGKYGEIEDFSAGNISIHDVLDLL